jgi:hypothetical protein
MENGYIESFHGKFREECLREHWFLTLDAIACLCRVPNTRPNPVVL